MAQGSTQSYFTPPPSITEADLLNFYSVHFSQPSICHFSTRFISPIDPADEYDAEEEDDGLGYYPDGVKRTLTDEQIAMFRHTEVHRLLREGSAQGVGLSACNRKDIVQTRVSSSAETKDGQLEDSAPATGAERLDQAAPQILETDELARTTARGKKKGQKQGKWSFKQHVKPDLRKRTWDKVEHGLESLDYGEDHIPIAPTTRQRKQVSYDDV